jgi:L-malate glycosyltransferase
MSTKTNLLFVCHDAQLYGSQQSLLLLIQCLPPNLYHCYVSVARHGPLEEKLCVLPHVTLLKHQRIQWVKHDPRSFLQQVSDVLGLCWVALPRALQLKRLIVKYHIDIVHTNSSVSLEGALASYLGKIPHIWHIRELLMIPSPKFHLVLGCTLSRWIIARGAKRVLAISDVVLQQFVPYFQRYPDRFYRVYNALPHATGLSNDQEYDTFPERKKQALVRLGLPPEKENVFYIGYIGRISEGKGLHNLLQAMTLIQNTTRPICLLVAGQFVDTAYERQIKAQLDTLKNRPEGQLIQVCLLGFQNNLTDLYTLLDVLVVPSLNEPFGRVVIESMANGVPCIGSNAGGIPELIEHNKTGWLYPPDCPEQLANLLQDVLQEMPGTHERLKQVSAEARQMVTQRFNIETLCQTMQHCYQSVLSPH